MLSRSAIARLAQPGGRAWEYRLQVPALIETWLRRGAEPDQKQGERHVRPKPVDVRVNSEARRSDSRNSGCDGGPTPGRRQCRELNPRSEMANHEQYA